VNKVLPLSQPTENGNESIAKKLNFNIYIFNSLCIIFLNCIALNALFIITFILVIITTYTYYLLKKNINNDSNSMSFI